jgi:hypothetical protein
MESRFSNAKIPLRASESAQSFNPRQFLSVLQAFFNSSLDFAPPGPLALLCFLSFPFHPMPFYVFFSVPSMNAKANSCPPASEAQKKPLIFPQCA